MAALSRRRLLALGGAAATAALLVGCGFQLRSADSLPTLPPLSLEGDTSTPLTRELESVLTRQGTEVTANAPWRVTLGAPSVENRALGSEGRANRDHELTMRVTLSVQRRQDNAYVLNNEVMSTSTRIRINDDDLLNREALLEEANLTLARQLARRIVERLGTLEAPS
ncbi:LPS assembly lipoprotein LptE [Halomonas sp. HNIBRBA4712]|uniref:LPS-assembly lipoprotein LptE n=1 Tax=Halomonas sp. HNIBRBA4712 TaxID=3373087 RepID=UPI003744C698